MTAFGVNEVLFAFEGRWWTQAWSTLIVGVAGGQLLDMIKGRSAAGLSAWQAAIPPWGRGTNGWVVKDLLGRWRLAFETIRHAAGQLADPAHLVKLAYERLDDVRRRVQNETIRHWGRKDDLLCRSRSSLTKADEQLSGHSRTRLPGLLDASDPHSEVRTSPHAKQTYGDFYDIDNPDLAVEFVHPPGHDIQDPNCPAEIRRLGRTIVRLSEQISAGHQARLSNGPIETAINLIKRAKRMEFGFRRFTNYRIRSMLYAGGPIWDLLATVARRRKANRKNSIRSTSRGVAELFEGMHLNR